MGSKRTRASIAYSGTGKLCVCGKDMVRVFRQRTSLTFELTGWDIRTSGPYARMLGQEPAIFWTNTPSTPQQAEVLRADGPLSSLDSAGKPPAQPMPIASAPTTMRQSGQSSPNGTSARTLPRIRPRRWPSLMVRTCTHPLCMRASREIPHVLRLTVVR